MHNRYSGVVVCGSRYSSSGGVDYRHGGGEYRCRQSENGWGEIFLCIYYSLFRRPFRWISVAFFISMQDFVVDGNSEIQLAVIRCVRAALASSRARGSAK